MSFKPLMMWKRVSRALCLAGLVLSAQARAQTQVAVQQPANVLPLRVVDKKSFCASLQKTFESFGQQNGYDKVQTRILASSASSILVQEFRSGRATDYVSATELARLTRLPNRTPENGYLPVANFVGQAMGLGNNVTLALSAGELRFIPLAQKGMELVVIAQNAASLTPERVKKVAEVAKSMSVKISVVWVGSAAEDVGNVEEARSVAWLAAVTGGTFVNLSGKDNPCLEAS